MEKTCVGWKSHPYEGKTSKASWHGQNFPIRRKEKRCMRDDEKFVIYFMMTIIAVCSIEMIFLVNESMGSVVNLLTEIKQAVIP